MPTSPDHQQTYIRTRDLPRLLGLWPADAANLRSAGLTEIVARLATALRAERRRALARDWTYDLNRHAALKRAHDAELAELARYQRWRRLARLAEHVAAAPRVRL